MKRLICSIITLVSISAFAEEEPIFPYEPWFTGPLLAPTSVTAPPEHPNIQVGVAGFKTYGEYDSNWKIKKETPIWTVSPFLFFQYGFTKSFGLEIYTAFSADFKKNQSASHQNDTLMYLGYQVSNDTKGTWIPDFRIVVEQVFPTGKYQRLNPKKEGIDSTGQGSFQTGPVLVIHKLFYLPCNFLSLQASIGYLFPVRVVVSGFNTFGGGFGTKGKVKPGRTLIAFFSGEYSITQNWVFAFDSDFLWQGKSRFSGRKGVLENGKQAHVGLPTTILISFAPEIEYNFSANAGILAGLWFTVAGKNSSAFASAFISYVYVF